MLGQFQKALNRVWDVRPERRSGWLHWIITRVLSLGMIVVIGFLLLVSLAVTSAVNWLVADVQPVWVVLNRLMSMGLYTLSFAILFKFLPDVKISWRSVWVGALVTAGLFEIGKWAIGTYLGYATIGSAYGAAGSIVVMLVWVYYAGTIVLFGAELTQVYAHRTGQGIRPASYAVATESFKPAQADRIDQPTPPPDPSPGG